MQADKTSDNSFMALRMYYIALQHNINILYYGCHMIICLTAVSKCNISMHMIQ